MSSRTQTNASGQIPTDPILVTIRECQRLTGLGRTKIYELINDQALEAVKCGGRTLVKMKSIRALESCLLPIGECK